jgi:hypothetical protein
LAGRGILESFVCALVLTALRAPFGPEVTGSSAATSALAKQQDGINRIAASGSLLSIGRTSPLLIGRPFDRTSAPHAVVLLTCATRLSRTDFVRPSAGTAHRSVAARACVAFWQ